jgi:hypothetical protein
MRYTIIKLNNSLTTHVGVRTKTCEFFFEKAKTA